MLDEAELMRPPTELHAAVVNADGHQRCPHLMADRQADTETRTERDTQAHAERQAHRQTDTQTRRHAATQAHRHKRGSD